MSLPHILFQGQYTVEVRPVVRTLSAWPSLSRLTSRPGQANELSRPLSGGQLPEFLAACMYVIVRMDLTLLSYSGTYGQGYALRTCQLLGLHVTCPSPRSRCRVIL